MNKTTLFIMSGTILLTSTYTLAQTRPHNNPIPEPIPQITIPSPQVTVPTPPVIEVPTASTLAPLSDQVIEESNGGPQYKNKHNQGKNKAIGKNKHNKGKHKGKNKGKYKGKKHKGEHKGKHKGEGKGKGKHKGKYNE